MAWGGRRRGAGRKPGVRRSAEAGGDRERLATIVAEIHDLRRRLDAVERLAASIGTPDEPTIQVSRDA
jgi:hypothetical protein